VQIQDLAIPDVKIITPRKFGDDRGFFSETWNSRVSREVGVVRGLHFQTPPHAQDKLVRVLHGRIWDVAVDIRKASPTYGQWVAAEISAEAWNQILVPVGFAHGFCTLEPDTEVVYLVSDYYSASSDANLSWSDPDLAIDWPIEPGEAVLSEKDRNAAAFAGFQSLF